MRITISTSMNNEQYKNQQSAQDQTTLDPTNDADAFFHRGNACLPLNHFEEALENYEQALAIQPNHAPALCNRGNIFIIFKRFEDALNSFDKALTIQPNYADALANRGNVLLHLQRFEDALKNFDQALTMPSNHAIILANRGIALQRLHRLDEALVSFNQALAMQPENAETLSNRGVVLQHLNRFDEALADYAHALALQPDYAEAHWNESFCRLTLGDFAVGWQKHEWRWKQRQYIPLRNFSQPLWLGKESLRNRTILLHAEQGLGDTIQFCRYVPLIAKLGATVILEVQPSLKTLLRNLEGITHLIVQGETLPAFDFHCPLLSLPLACRTNLDSIPFGTSSSNASPTSFIARTLHSLKRWLPQTTSTSPAITSNYLNTDSLHKARWKNKLGAKTLPRIGLTWSGSATHINDHHRSIPLMDFMKIMDTQRQEQEQNSKPNQAQFYCLQKEIRPSDQALLTKLHTQNDIVFVGNDLKDFSDTAALISLMDLVITVDTSIAHLAGAMGKPVWILLPFNADWRWLTKRNDSPWYPSARLFRQPALGDWDSVVNDVKQALSNKEFA